MSSLFQKSWKTLLINGSIAALIGLLFLFITDDFLKTLILFFGIFLLAISLVMLCVDIYNICKEKPWGINMLNSIILLVFGLIFALYPDVISKLVYLVFGLWTAISGIFQLSTAIKYRKHITQPGIAIISAVFLSLLGIFLIIYPNFFQTTTTKIIGAFLLVTGLWQIFNGFRFKRICKMEIEYTDAEVVDEEQQDYKN